MTPIKLNYSSITTFKKTLDILGLRTQLVTFVAPSLPDQCCPNFRIILKPLSNNFEMGRGEGGLNKRHLFILRAKACFLRIIQFSGECFLNLQTGCLSVF